MKILSTLLLLLLTFSHTLLNQALAESETKTDLPEYDVEIILFEDAHARYINSETWSSTAITEESSEATANITGDTEKPADPGTGAIAENTYVNIKPGILSRAYKGLKASSEYNILFYGAWRQSGLDRNTAFEINITELDNAHKASSENTITGTVKLVLARYLHIYNQLIYKKKPSSPETAVENEQLSEASNFDIVPEMEIYPLNSHRRMRSKELHYIDHPLVGMLIQVNPVEKPKDEAKKQ